MLQKPSTRSFGKLRHCHARVRNMEVSGYGVVRCLESFGEESVSMEYDVL